MVLEFCNDFLSLLLSSLKQPSDRFDISFYCHSWTYSTVESHVLIVCSKLSLCTCQQLNTEAQLCHGADAGS